MGRGASSTPGRAPRDARPPPPDALAVPERRGARRGETADRRDGVVACRGEGGRRRIRGAPCGRAECRAASHEVPTRGTPCAKRQASLRRRSESRREPRCRSSRPTRTRRSRAPSSRRCTARLACRVPRRSGAANRRKVPPRASARPAGPRRSTSTRSGPRSARRRCDLGQRLVDGEGGGVVIARPASPARAGRVRVRRCALHGLW